MHEYLQLVQDTLSYLKQHPEPSLASFEDWDYFRQKFKAAAPKAPTPLPPAPVVVLPKPRPAPVPPPAPVVEEKKVAPPPPAPAPVRKPVEEPTSSLEWPVLSFGKWQTILKKVAPELPVLSDLPSDAIAKKIATRWKAKNLSAPITVLSYQEIPEQKALLEQIARALDVSFGPAKLVAAETLEKQQQWETFLSVDALQLVITCDYTLWQMPELLKFYKETALKRQLKEKQLFLLPDLSLYLKDPLLKRSLWKALCQICEPLSPPSCSTKI